MRIRLSRRDFIARTVAASSTTALLGGGALRSFAAEASAPPIVVFSKVYQELKLDFDEAAAVTAEAGIDGIDCPVRPGGEILPAHVAQQLPEYAAALKKRSLQVPLLTTGITGISSPGTEVILRTAKQVGVQFYRLGFVLRKPELPVSVHLSWVPRDTPPPHWAELPVSVQLYNVQSSAPPPPPSIASP